MSRIVHPNTDLTKPVKRVKKPKAIKKIGKQTLAWQAERAQWFLDHPSDTYRCHYCGMWMSHERTTLDHENNRNHTGRLLPSCYWCNSKKGSVSHDRYVMLNHPGHRCVA